MEKQEIDKVIFELLIQSIDLIFWLPKEVGRLL